MHVTAFTAVLLCTTSKLFVSRFYLREVAEKVQLARIRLAKAISIGFFIKIAWDIFAAAPKFGVVIDETF